MSAPPVSSVYNLTDSPLTSDETMLLEKGMKFIPTNPKWDHAQWCTDIGNFTKKIKSKWIYEGQTKAKNKTKLEYEKLKRPHQTTWQPPLSQLTTPQQDFIKELSRALTNLKPLNQRDNLKKGERRAIKSLKNKTNCVIKPADKGSGTVIWSLENYRKEAYSQLETNNYQEIPTSILAETETKINNHLQHLVNKGIINNAEKTAMTQTDGREAEFYMLPKIHKNLQTPPGRPIMSGNGHPTEWISAWADTKLQKLMKSLPSYLRDSGHLLNLLKDHDIPHNSRIISLDVCSLYTNIPHEDGLQAIMDVGTEFDPLTDYTPVRDIASLVLKNNIFKFDGRHYIQTQGTAMGTRMAPAYANIFMHPIEKNILANHPNITFWRRYIDDIICIMETDDAHTVDDLLAYANQLHRTIKFTMEADTKGIPFLDMILTIKNRRINSQPYTKPTDRKLYIRKDSCHPTHQKTGIAYSQALRLKRICSSTTDYISETDTLKTNLIRRGYDENMIQKQIDKATAITREDLLKNSTTNRPDADEAIHFITTYRHGLQNTHNIIKSMCDKFNVEIVFRIAYRRDKNIKDILVRAKLPDATERTPITTQLTSRYVNNTNSHIYCRKDVDDRTCVRCHMLALDRKFILHRGSVHVINKQITSCKQLHNIYIIRCLICDTWDQHTELITPHDLINNLRTRGFSISPEEHPHPRSSSDIMLYPVWSYHTATVRCTECKFCISTNITRMPTTIEQEIKASVTSIKLGIFSKDFAYTSCQRQTCQVCTRVENGLLQCRSGANYRTRPVLCHTTGCVYALQCLWCSQVDIGQTGRELHTRIREHIRNIKISCTTSNFATHMNSHNAPLNFKIFVLNYVNTKFDRLLQESSWINQTKAEINNTIEGHYTLSPTCLQVYNHYQHSATCQPIFKALPR